ncbi:unnamed protein product, partial [Rotaria sordida]
MSFQQLKNFLVPRKNVTDLVEYRVCNECASLSEGKTQCRNPNCKLFGSFIKYPTEFLYFPTEFQLLSILSRTKIKFYKNDIRTSPATELSDVCDGAVYRKLVRTQRDPFITLTLNIDGISIFQSSNRSIWIFTAAINEVARQDRFKLNNMLILAISSSLCKPSKAQMQSMLKPIVQNLKRIENGISFNTPDQATVFLILSCNDKPAQALLQNLGEPHGRFGCGSCTIEGDKASTGKTMIRVFPTAPTITYSLRTNEWYDQMIETVCNPNYSTFSFESILGVITSSVHGTRMHAQEIRNNIDLIRTATADIERNDFNQQLKLFYTGMNAFKKQECLATIEKPLSGSTHLSTYRQLNECESLFIQQQLHCKMSHPFYKVLFVGNVRFTVSDGKMLDDGCVAFEDGQGTLEAGFIRAIQHRSRKISLQSPSAREEEVINHLAELLNTIINCHEFTVESEISLDYISDDLTEDEIDQYVVSEDSELDPDFNDMDNDDSDGLLQKFSLDYMKK